MGAILGDIPQIPGLLNAIFRLSEPHRNEIQAQPAPFAANRGKGLAENTLTARPRCLAWVPPSAAMPERARVSPLDDLQHRTVGSKGGGKQAAAAAGAGIERDREFALDETAHLPVKAAHHAAKAVERLGEVDNVPIAPPEGVALAVEWARWIDPGMDKQQLVVVTDRSMAQAAEQRGMAG